MSLLKMISYHLLTPLSFYDIQIFYSRSYDATNCFCINMLIANIIISAITRRALLQMSSNFADHFCVIPASSVTDHISLILVARLPRALLSLLSPTDNLPTIPHTSPTLASILALPQREVALMSSPMRDAIAH